MNKRTRRDIVTAFNKLIYKHELDQITVEMIVREAGVSKATFYRYFKDKYDVMNFNYKELLDRLVESPHCKSYRDLYYSLFSIGRREWKPLRYAFESTGVNSMENYIFSYSKDLVCNITKKNRDGMFFSPAEELQIDVFCSGISAMYKKYILDEYDMSPDVAADALFDIMPPSLRDYWW